MIRFRNSAAFTALLIGLIGLASTAVAADLEPFVPNGMTPSDMHRTMGEMKASALDRSRRAQAAGALLPQADQTNYDVKWYDISIRVNDTTEVLYGTVTFVAEATVDGVEDIAIDFYSGMVIDSIIEPDRKSVV